MFNVSVPVTNELMKAAAKYLVEEYKGTVVRGILITFGRAFNRLPLCF